MDLSNIARNLTTSARASKGGPAGRPQPGEVRLLAVSKTFGLDHVRAAAAAGQDDFGENRVQEALQKIDGSADLRIRWHLIGTLQSNKVRKAVPRFSAIHSVDSLRLLDAIDAAAAEAGTAPELLVQVDLAGEATKHGAPQGEAGHRQGRLRCRSARCVGLMTIPPFFDDPENTRPFFARLRDLRDTLLHEGLPPDDAAGVVHGYESRFRNRRAGGSHHRAARHGHLWDTPCLIRSPTHRSERIALPLETAA